MGKSLEVALTSDFVWQYFTIVDTDLSKATCTKCNTTVSRGNDPKKYSIHSLKRHLKTHEIIWAELENYLEQRTTPSKKYNLDEDSTHSLWMVCSGFFLVTPLNDMFLERS